MLILSFKGHLFIGSGVEGFYGFFLPYMGMVAILVLWLGRFEHIFVPSALGALHEIWLQLAEWILRRCLK